MLSRYAVPLLCAAAIVFACGPRPHAAETAASTAAPAPREKVKPADLEKQPLATTVDVSVAQADDAPAEVRFSLHVSNRADRNVELMFPSGLTHDFVVRDASGREVWRWSEGRMYTQALQSKLLKGGESATYSETWQPGARRGRHTVTATLRASSHAVEQSMEFELP